MSQFALFTTLANIKSLHYIQGTPLNLGFQDTLYRLASSMTLTIGTINQQNNERQSLPLIMLTHLHNPKLRLSLTSHHELDESLVDQAFVVQPPLENPAQREFNDHQQLERKNEWHENISSSIIMSMEKNSY